jgi:hypothetical protein
MRMLRARPIYPSVSASMTNAVIHRGAKIRWPDGERVRVGRTALWIDADDTGVAAVRDPDDAVSAEQGIAAVAARAGANDGMRLCATASVAIVAV